MKMLKGYFMLLMLAFTAMILCGVAFFPLLALTGNVAFALVPEIISALAIAWALSLEMNKCMNGLSIAEDE